MITKIDSITKADNNSKSQQPKPDDEHKPGTKNYEDILFEVFDKMYSKGAIK